MFQNIVTCYSEGHFPFPFCRQLRMTRSHVLELTILLGRMGTLLRYLLSHRREEYHYLKKRMFDAYLHMPSLYIYSCLATYLSIDLRDHQKSTIEFFASAFDFGRVLV